jgi:glutathione S-transferase
LRDTCDAVLVWDSIGATIPCEFLFLAGSGRRIEVTSFTGFSVLIIDSRGGWQLVLLVDIRRSAIPRAWPVLAQWKGQGVGDRRLRRNGMITLYHCAAARSFRPLWTLEELGLPYELKMLPFPPRVFAREYLGINPLGTIPLMLDGETRMTESAGIAQYLVSRYGPTPLAVDVDEPDYGAFINWLHFGEATLTFPQTLVLRYTQLEPEERRNPQVATDYAKWFFGRLRAVEAATAKSDTLCAGRFTAADISVGYALLLADRLGLSRDFGPAVAAYWQRLQAREGFRRAVEAENLASDQQNVARRY